MAFDELDDNTGAPESVVESLIRQQDPDTPAGPVDPDLTLGRLVRKTGAQMRTPKPPAQGALDFSGYGSTEPPADRQQPSSSQPDFSQFGGDTAAPPAPPPPPTTVDAQTTAAAQAGGMPSYGGSAPTPDRPPPPDEWPGYVPTAATALEQHAVTGAGAGLKGAATVGALNQGPKMQEGWHLFDDGTGVTQSQAERAGELVKGGMTKEAALDLVRRTPDPNADPRNSPLYRAGTSVEQFGRENFPLSKTQQESMTGRVAGGVGGLVGMAPGMAAGTAVAGPVGGIAAGAAQMGLQAAGETFDAAIEKGATPEQAAKAAGLNGLASGALGALPLGVILRPIQQVSPGLTGWAAAKLEHAVQSGIAFTMIGEAQEWLAQEIARDFYDPKAEYKPDVKRVVASLLTGGIAGLAAPVHKPDVDEFLRRARTAGEGPGGTDYSGFGTARGAQTRADIDEFLRRDAEQQPAGPPPALPAPTEPGARSAPEGPTEPPQPPPGGDDAALREAGYSPAAIARWSPEERARRLRELGTAPADTGQNVPETDATLRAQRQQLERGERAVQMFPQGTPEPPLPDGMQRVETPRGVFHFDPAQVDAAKITALSAQGRENELLGLGPVPKSEAMARARAGEPPVAVVERQQDGTEVRAAAGTAGTAAAQQAAMEAAKSPGDTVGVEHPAETVAQRAGTGTRGDPVRLTTGADVERAAAMAREDHTAPQGEANNIQRGHAVWNGIPITFEAKAGGVRRGLVPKTGESWEATMAEAYGYVKGTKGADKQAVDIFFGRDLGTAKNAYVVDEMDRETGKFRQHKVFAGFADPKAALAAYLGSSGKTKDEVGGMRELSIDELKEWLNKPRLLKKPISDAVKNRPQVTEKSAEAPAIAETAKPAETGGAEAAAESAARESQVPEKAAESDELPGGAEPTSGRIEPEHHDAVEAALRDAGVDPIHVAPVDVARAAEIMGDEGMSPSDAFQTAVMRGLVDDGLLTRPQVEHLYGENAALLEPSKPPQRGVRDQAPGAAAGRPAAPAQNEQPARGGGAGPQEHEAGETAEARQGGERAGAVRAEQRHAGGEAGGAGDQRGAAGGVGHAGLPEGAAEAEERPVAAKGPRARRRLTEPSSLLPFIAAQGGLEPTGDLRHLGLDESARAVAPNQGPRPVLRRGGLTLHDLTEKMREAGYLPDAAADQPDDVTEREVIDLIDEEIRGNKHFPIGREHEDRQARERAEDESRHMAERDAAGRLDDFLAENHIPADTILPADRTLAAELMVEHGMAPDDALERALITNEIEDGTVEPGAPHFDDLEDIVHETEPEPAQGSGEVPAAEVAERAAEPEAPVAEAGEHAPRAGETEREENWDLDGKSAEIQAGDSDEAVTVTLRREGPWDFNDTFPAPDPEVLAALDKEGRNPFADGFDVENVAAMVDEGMNDLTSEVATVRGATERIGAIEGGKERLPKRTSKDKVLKGLRAEVSDAIQNIDDRRSSYAEIFGEPAADAMLEAARERVGWEAKTGGGGVAAAEATAPTEPTEAPETTRIAAEDLRPGDNWEGSRGKVVVESTEKVRGRIQATTNRGVMEFDTFEPIHVRRTGAETSATEATPAGEQGVLPGAEQAGPGEMAQRGAEAALKPKKAQQAADEGLFGEHGQSDLVDMARAAPKGPPIVKFRKDAVEIEAHLPAVEPGHVRLWRGNRTGEVGKNPHFTNDLPGIALPFREMYSGGLSYVDVTAADAKRYEDTGAVAPGAEFTLPLDVAARAKVVGDTPKEKTDAGRVGEAGTPALDEVAAAESRGVEESRQVEGGVAGGGESGAGRDQPTGEPGVPPARGGGGGVEEPHPAAPGAGGGTAEGAGGRARAKGKRVSEPPPTEPERVAPAEAPNLPKHNFRITDEVGLGKGSEAVKFKDNLAAVRILKALETENRRATPDEQRALARYVGWGGLANAFGDDEGAFKPAWADRGAELAGLLTPEELRAARRSTRNAHYTSKPVIDAMWKAVDRLGYRGGLALELSSGTGNFLGLVPDHLAGRTRFIGVENDSLTQRIAQQLYPQDTILHSGLQQVPLPDGEAVLNIGNPPFGAESLRFRFKPEFNGLSIHNQFFLAGLDALQPKGVQALVVSRFLMDAQDPEARREMAIRADLLGAIRLPETAFRENARTEVVTDIVFLQRRSPDDQAEMQRIFDTLKDRKIEKSNRDALEAQVPKWVETMQRSDPAGGEPIHINAYFDRHPDMIMGRLDRTGTMYGREDVTVRLPEGADLGKMLDAAVGKLPKGVLNLDDETVERSLARHNSMAKALGIAIAGHEPGHVEARGDHLTQLYERETPTGAHEMAERELAPSSPWSRQLFEDHQGRWYTLEPRINEKGEKVKVEDSNRLIYDRKFFENNEVPQGMRLGLARFKRLRDLVGLRDLTKRQIVLETNDASPREMEGNRKKLAAAYETYVKRHGLINEPSGIALLNDMPDGALVMALEHNFRKGVSEAKAKRLGEKAAPPSAAPAPIMSRRVVPKFEPITKVRTAQEALAVSLSDLGRVDPARAAGLLGVSEDEAMAKLTEGDNPLVYRDPETNDWASRDAYLAGQVVRKLAAAKAAGLTKNVQDLERILPARWTADQVNVVPGASWVPLKMYADFAQHLVGGSTVVHYSPLTNSFEVHVNSFDHAKHAAWRTDNAGFPWLYSRMLNSQPIRIVHRDNDGTTHVDEEGTALAQLKAREIGNEFADWVFASGDRRNQLVDIFNEKFNTRVTRQFDGSHLQLPGKVPDEVIDLRRNQKNAIWRGIQQRFVLYDHVVGAGKTFAAIGRAMERRRMGLSRKPMFVVPNHLVGQWTSDFYRLYPGAKVLAAGANQFDRDNRRKLFAKIATGDYDAVIVPHSSFGFIGISRETELRFLDEELRLAHKAIEEAEEQAAIDGTSGGRGKPFNVKEAERLAEKIENRIDGIKNQKRDRLLTFEQMGVDDMTVDEAHEFKNLFYSSRMSGVRGMGNKTGSAKAFDLYTKIRVLRENPNGSVAFATGTPISNSAVEMYTMLRYLAADELKELGLENFDAWRSQHVTAESKYEPTEAGGLKEVTRLGRNWSNMRALMELWYSVTDAVTQDDLNKWYAEDNAGARFPVPKVNGGGRKEVVVKPTPAQSDMLQQVVAGFNHLPQIGDPKERNAARLRLMDRARKVSLDIRAVDPRYPSKEEGGKLDQIADRAAAIYRKWNADAGTQLVFLDRSVPKAKGDDAVIKLYDGLVKKRDDAVQAGDEGAYRLAQDALDRYDPNEIAELRAAQGGGWNAYDQLKQNLIKRGIPADEIRFVQEANNDAEKKALFDAVNDGKIRVLLGSTQRMGAGTNVQERLVALHHGDVTWKPSDIEQREGRIVRQGNKLMEKYGDDFAVDILAYATERTVDAKMWDLNATKLKMINGIRRYDGSFTMDFDDSDAVGMAEIAALASGDPMLLERVKLLAEIDKLELLERAHRRRMFGIADQIDHEKRTIAEMPGRIREMKEGSRVLRERLAAVEEGVEKRNATVEGDYVTSDMQAHKAATEAIAKQQAGKENARYAINIDGKRLTTKADIEDAIKAAFGDNRPFEATVGGKTFIARAPLAKVIADRAHDMVGKIHKDDDFEKATLGKMLGYDLDAEMAKTRYGHYALSLYLSDGGKTIASGEHTRADKLFTPAGARVAIDDLEQDVSRKSYDDSKRMAARLAEAKEELPKLEKQRGAPFAQADEISTKRRRLEEVTQELAAKTKADEGAPAQQPRTVAMAAAGPAAPPLPSGLYSAVEKLIRDTPRMDKARPDQWMGLLRNKPGIKPEELRWLGLAEWLGKQDGPVTRQQVLDYVRANQIEIKEVTKQGGKFSDNFTFPTDIDEWTTGETTPLEEGSTVTPITYPEIDPGNRIDIFHWPNGEVAHYSVIYSGTEVSTWNTFADAVHEFGAILADEGVGGGDVRFPSYRLPGGENYRETLLTLPQKPMEPVGDRYYAKRDEGREDNWSVFDRQTGEATHYGTMDHNRDWAESTARSMNTPPGPRAFTESHWNEPNVVAHVRHDDRTGPNGEKILHVAEVQSDWHQKGRERGYGPGVISTRYQLMNEGRESKGVYNTAAEAEEMRQRLHGQTMPGERRPEDTANWTVNPVQVTERHGVPDAPFKTTWPELVLKRMLRYAAENGYDRLTWDTGETNAARYDLSKWVNHISAERVSEDRVWLRVTYDTGDEAGRQSFANADLAEYVGKEFAAKILAEPVGAKQEYEGVNFPVGGEGQREFYDRMLPAMARKLVRPFGGDVGRSELLGAAEPTTANLARSGREAEIEHAEDGRITVRDRDTGGVLGEFDGLADYEKAVDLANRHRVPGVAVHSVDITPSMRAGIMEKGFPVFHAPVPQGVLGEAGRQRMRLIETALRNLVHDIAGKRIRVEFPDYNLPGPLHGYGEHAAERAAASYTTIQNLIKIALDVDDARNLTERALHESWHAIEDLLATDDEVALLKREEPRLRALMRTNRLPLLGGGVIGDLADTVAGFEARAHAFQTYAADRAAGGHGAGIHIGLRRFFEKVLRFIRAFQNWLHGHGWKTYEDIFGQAAAGEMRDRPTRPTSRLNEILDAEKPQTAAMARDIGLPEKMPAPVSSYIKPDIIKAHPDYAAAKAGDTAAALRLVRDTVSPASIEAAKRFGKDALYLPIVSEEMTGPNRIPRALAEFYAHATGAKTTNGIIQVTKAYHTGASAMERLLVRPEFAGAVDPGGRYVLVDDVTVMGSTLAELADHIRKNGGTVAGVVTLANASRTNVLTPKAQQITEITRRFGNAIRELFDTDPRALSGPEATYLLNFRDADALRARAAAAWRQRGERLAAKGITPAGGSSGPPRTLAMAASGPAGAPPPRPGLSQRIRGRIADLFASERGTQAIERFSNLSHRVRILQNLVEARFSGEDPERPIISEPMNSRLPPGRQFYAMKRLFPGKVGYEVSKFNKAHLDPLVRYMKGNGISLADAGDYLYALHAVERNEEVAQLHPDDHQFVQALSDPEIVGGSGMSRAEAERIIDRIESGPNGHAYPEFLRHIEAVRDFNLDTLVRYGLESRSLVNSWKEKYAHYAPLRGWENAPEEAPPNYGPGGQFNVRGPEVRQALGRGSRADNPLVNLLDQSYRFIERGERNRYLVSLGSALSNLPRAMRDDIATLNKGRPRRVVDPESGLVTVTDDFADRFRPEAVFFKVKGEPRYIVFKDRKLAEAVKRMNPEAGPVVSFVLGWVNKMKALWTHYSPEFLLRHFGTRYPIEGLLNSQELRETGDYSTSRYAKDAFPIWGRATRAILAVEAGRVDAGNPLHGYWQEMQQQGGSMTFRSMRDTDLLREHLNLLLRDLSGNPVKSFAAKWRHAIEGIDHYTNAMDNALRLAVYAQARDQGMEPQEAALRARDATIDYQLRGLWSKYLGLTMPFYNTAMRTGTRLSSALVRSKVMRNVFLGVYAASVMLALWNYLAGGDDKDGTPYFDKVAPWDRELNLIVMNPLDRDSKGRPQPIKIPLPYNWALPFNLGNVTVGAFLGKEGIVKHAQSLLKSAVTAFTPLGEGGNVFDYFTPEPVRPIAHIIENKTWTGAPLHADPFTQKGPNAYATRRGPAAAGEGWQAIAQGINTATGGDRGHSGILDFHPEDYREIFDQFFGAQKRFAIEVGHTGQSIAKGEAPNPAEIPMLRVLRGTDYDKADAAAAAHQRYLATHPWVRP